MTRFESGGEVPTNWPPNTERAEVAALAAKTVRLHSGPRAWFWWFGYSIAWAVTLSLGIAALLRIFYHDGNHFLTWINAFTRYVYLPVYLCLLWALWKRRWLLALASLAVVGCHVVWMAPDFLRDRRFDSPPHAAASSVDSSSTVRIFFANVLAANEEFEALLDEVAESDPDIVVLVECYKTWHDAFRKSPVMSSYIHGNVPWRFPAGMVSIFSRIPLSNEMENFITGRAVRAVDVQLGSQTLRLVCLHGPRPMYRPEYDYAGYWNQIIPLLAAEATPLVVVGDFNATEHSLVYQRLRAARLRSAHDDRGRGYATTWPNGTWALPPIRIDQAFLSPDVACERISEGRGLGSDHKPLILDVRIREDGARGAAQPHLAVPSRSIRRAGHQTDKSEAQRSAKK